MLRLFLLSLIVVTTLFCANDKVVLDRASVLVKSSSKTDQFRAYNDYKNLYLRAIMGGDDNLRYESLRGIVKSGKNLHIDISQYAKELSNMKPKKVKQPSVKKNKHTTKKITTQDIKVKSRHKLERVYWRDGRLVLKFDTLLKSNQVNYFKLEDKKKKRYRYIFDITKSMLIQNQSLRHKDISRIKLSQFNPKTLRLVIENDKQLHLRFKIDTQELIINLGVTTIPAPLVYKTAKKSSKIIVIDAGHGGKDSGAVGYRKYREKVVVLQTALKLRKILQKQGYRVYMTRANDTFIKLKNRTKYANKKKASIFVSIHANSVPKRNRKKAHGVETYFLSTGRSQRSKNVAAKENAADISAMKTYGKNSFLNLINHEKIIASNKLGIDVQRGLMGSLKSHYKDIRDNGVKDGPFWVLVGAQMPAVLVEIGFISHPVEGKRLAKGSYQNYLAQGLAEGINNYFIHNP